MITPEKSTFCSYSAFFHVEAPNGVVLGEHFSDPECCFWRQPVVFQYQFFHVEIEHHGCTYCFHLFQAEAIILQRAFMLSFYGFNKPLGPILLRLTNRSLWKLELFRIPCKPACISRSQCHRSPDQELKNSPSST